MDDSSFERLPQTLALGQVAEVIGMSERSFANRRRELEAQGFPPKLPGTRKWAKAAIRHWLETNGGTLQRPDETADPLLGAYGGRVHG